MFDNAGAEEKMTAKAIRLEKTDKGSNLRIREKIVKRDTPPKKRWQRKK